MADLTISDVTVTLAAQDRDFLGVGLKVSFPSIAFGDGAKTYPANGVPLPAIGAFGMHKAIKRVFIQPPPGDGYVYKYDSTNHTIRIYQSASHTHTHTVTDGTAGNAVTLNTDHLEASGGGTLTSSALAAAALAEMGNVAVTAKTLDLMVLGV